ncbi:aspartate/glutamate racemase family protein [Pseudorhodoferax sp.]|uniref:aspartate/glutamate racemase family protein n=1 Tax=Pseudorhodoferax sp. TaxID=1993553 RepID=UPI0039E35271
MVGICGAALREGGAHGRCFGVATVTPRLADVIQAHAARLGLAGAHAGIRLTDGAPRAMAADPPRLPQALAAAARRCVEDDGAQAW